MGNRVQNPNLFWACNRRKNFGDWIGPYLFEKMTGREPDLRLPGDETADKIYFTVGSILSCIERPSNVEVWGSGIIDSGDIFPEPKKIHAVRGPRSRYCCESQGYDCPRIYGDPAILMPMYFHPRVDKQWDLGVVAHMCDYEIAYAAFAKSGVKVISVQRDVEDVVEDILTCNFIVSSSLHGLIIAHSYGIPALHIELSDKLMGDGIKFVDYFESCGLKLPQSIPVPHSPNASNLLKRVQNSPLPDLERLRRNLLDCCPFLSN